MKLNILVTINKNYLKYLFVMLKSLKENNKKHNIVVYIVAKDIVDNDVNSFFKKYQMEYQLIEYSDETLDNAPTTKRYPSVIYYRLLAAKYLPKNVDKILYLDPDIIVLKDLNKLYGMEFNEYYFIGSSNVKKVLRKFNELKNKAPRNSPYLNTGVLLINVKKLRSIDISNEIYNYILENKNKLFLPDQDILQGLYGDKVKQIDNLIYNLSDRTIRMHNLKVNTFKIDEKWVEDNCCIIHYFGKNKPWKDNYKGILKKFYLTYER